MAYTNVDFYERMKDLQEKQHESEQMRLELEKEMNSFGKSDHRVAKLKAVRLQNYWKKVCEDEKRSQWRNEQLLKDFDRVESHMATLSEKTERLSIMKKQYEDYIERAYPNWKEKVMQYQRLKQKAEKEGHMRQVQEQLQQERAAMAAPPSQQTPNIGGYLNLPDSQQQYRISQTLPNFQNTPNLQPNSMSNFPPDAGYQPYQTTQPQLGSHGIHVETGQFTPQYQAGVSPEYVNIPGRSGHPAAQQPPVVIPHVTTSAHSTMHTISSLPSASRDNMHNLGPHAGAVHQPVRETQQSPTSPMYMGDVESEDEVVEEPISPRAPPPAVPGNAAALKPPAAEEGDHSEKLSDFGSDDELPLSDIQEVKPLRTPRSSRGSITLKSPEPGPAITPSNVYTRPDLTMDGLFNLFGAVENELPCAFSPGEYYRTTDPAKSVKKEILNNAVRGAALSHVEGTSISMVILEQIQLIVLSSETGCMLPDRILYRPAARPTEESISENVHATITGFWEKLYDHFKMLLKHDIMTSEDIGDVFGPLLISSDSPYESNARILLKNLMDNVSPEELLKSPMSTDTFSTIPSPRKRDSLMKKGEQQRKHDEEEEDYTRPTMGSTSETLPPLDLESDGEEEPPPTGIQLPPPATTPMPNLSQTDAYRQLLEGTMSTQKTMSYEVSEESDSDDIEGQLGLSPRKQGTRQAAGSSTYTPTTKKPVQVPTEADGDDDSKVSTPSLPDTGGYAPSMGDTGKSGKSVTGSISLGSSGKGSKNPAFQFGDSDTDEDVVVPETEDKGHEGDDFLDFYQ